MTPAEFQGLALSWIGVVSVVGAAAIAAGAALYLNLSTRLNFHRDDIKTLTTDVKDINRALPAGSPALPVAAQQDAPAPLPAPVPPIVRPVQVTIMPGDTTLTKDDLAALHQGIDDAHAETITETTETDPFPAPLAPSALPAPTVLGISPLSQE